MLAPLPVGRAGAVDRAPRDESRPDRESAEGMDPKLAYWTAAFANMTLLMALAAVGARHARRGEIARHRRAMRTAALLVGLFLVSYPFKLAWLGREDMASWSTVSVGMLRLHETCVLVMLGAGGLALRRGLRLGRTRALIDAPDAPVPGPEALAGHRRMGRIALASVLLAWATAGVVLAGMYGRA